MSRFETKPGVKVPRPEDTRPKRFYKAAGTTPADGGFAVTLDGRPVRTVMKRPLVLPTKKLAEAVAAEWDAQGERVDPPSMPLTRLSNVTVDQAGERRDAFIAEVLKYAETDLLRHRADGPGELVETQTRVWQPFLDWAEQDLGAHLPAVTGILPADTRPEALDALKARAEIYDDWRLTALVQAASLSCSAVLGFALVEGKADGETVFAASRVDEDFQASQWGEDSEAAAAAAVLKGELQACARLLAALG
ncbi:ATP12 family chaperone protein [Hyphobacterium marinum]|uniref:ATP12 family protein n=1 Tax=Hyphobacterium marinum TaxID=3116574 RepID=A0ABU7LZB9_9PROT|nr:ATP12 family protein [Hyphobacterium sp. Y6023]MEE2566906.1 ATP12 family protein [Hyphobacterium sp. Y6023]